MKRHSPRKRRQGGFTLVEMSVTMAAAGLLFAAVTTGQELVDQAKAAKLINDVKSLEANIQRFAQIKGRLPGDCNADGVIDYAADATSRKDVDNNVRAEKYSYSVVLPTVPTDGTTVGSNPHYGCALLGSGDIATVAVDSTNANVWINDLKLAGVISDSAPNRDVAKMVNEDFVFVGKITDNGGESADGADYNAIVVHNVPQWMARRLATAINGQDAHADRSRVRQLTRLSANGTYAARWEAVQDDVSGSDPTAMRDAMVTVAYFFDRVPESKQQ